jgi:LuxR family maltose regulon positive regulatory protein
MDGYPNGIDSLCRAELAFFKGDLNSAEQHVREAIFQAREKGGQKTQYEVQSKGFFYLLRIHLANGDIPGSREAWQQLVSRLDISDYTSRYALTDILCGWVYAHIGLFERTAPWLRNEYEESELNLYFHNLESLVKAKTLFAENRYEEALVFLERKEVKEGLGSFHLGVLETTVLESVTLRRMGSEAEAIRTLEKAYETALGNNLDMPFIEYGEDMRLLAGAALLDKNCAIPRPWLETIRNKSSVYGKKMMTVVERALYDLGADSNPFLSSQELSILTGLSQGLTREEIAGASSLSVNTVKNMLKTIYNKLGAVNRADAIRIATQAGILKA